jgi:hypothetical protein
MAKAKKSTTTKPRRAPPQRSAVSAVIHSGLELIPKRPRKGKLATLDDFAAIDWKPWKRPKELRPGELLPHNDKLLACGVSGRAAFAIMLQSRKQLIEMHATLDHGTVDQIMADLASSAEMLKGVVYMIDAAYMRVLASAAAYDKAGRQFKGVAPSRRKRPAAATDPN